MLDIARNTNTHPMISNNALVMSIGGFKKPVPTMPPNAVYTGRPTVKAGSELAINASTEVIDVSVVAQNPQLIQYVEISDYCGRLYCSNDGTVHASCWLKIVTIAKDCQSCNVLLMMTSGGIVLKTIRSITPGEPLLMWFTENVLAMLNMPYLTNINIKGQNLYTCHLCNNHFEYPNPLKIHLALKCNRLDSNYLWTVLAKEVNAVSRSRDQSIGSGLSTFKFTLTGSPGTSPPSSLARTSPQLFARESSASVEENSFISAGIGSSISNNIDTFINYSPTSSDHASPTLSNISQVSPPSQTSFCSTSLSSSTLISPEKKNLDQRHSAFKPYINKPFIIQANNLPSCDKAMIISSFPPYPSEVIPIRSDYDQAARLETVVSNLGKSKQGHKCVYCGKIYSRKYGLKIHIRIHTGYKPLKCKYCSRPFGDPSNLNKHVRLHSEGETPYRCDMCGKVLVRRRDLERHIKSRHQTAMEHHQASDNSSDGAEI